jgi:hypothetical protein
MALIIHNLSYDVVSSGYFPVEVPPCFSTTSFAATLLQVAPKVGSFRTKSSRCAYHSIPRLQHHRRLLGVPNPLHQLRLALIIEQDWPHLEQHMNSSTLSLTRLAHVRGSSRGLERVHDFDALDRERLIRSSGSRFLLKADLSRFYHTLYTHSISWALHTKEVAKARQFDRTLLGNALDEALRNTQDKQTLGIPVGPVTSDLISELLGAAMDLQLSAENPRLKGMRFVDDYYLYFATRSEAEKALADLHSVTNHFGLEINPLKTKILELPEPIRPNWIAELRSMPIRGTSEEDDLLAFFSRAYDFAAKYPGSNVLKYAVKHTTGFTITPDSWEIYESFLLGSLVAEPTLAPTLAPVLLDCRDKGYPLSMQRLTDCLAEVISYHGRSKQAFEVAWALWISKLLGVTLPTEVWPGISLIDDSIVALIALDLRANGMADGLHPDLWLQHMQSGHLYSENWLLAYEALVKGWLPFTDRANYVANDDFFGELAQKGVEFYDVGTQNAATDADWLTAYLA